MSGERDFERELVHRLEQDAPPMPSHVLDSVLERVSSEPQLGPRGGWMGRLGWRPLIAVAAGLVVLAMLAYPRILELVDIVGWSSTGGPPGEVLRWDAASQFRGYPNQKNPTIDGYGNPVVFSYLVNRGALHDPSTYELLPDFAPSTEQDPAERWHTPDRWYDATIEQLYVGYLGGSPERLQVHPGPGGEQPQAAIVGWRSPDATRIWVEGSVEVDGSCGDGIVFSWAVGSAVIQSIELRRGEDGFASELDVQRGESVYFIVEAGADTDCDTTWLAVRIETR